MKLKQQHGIDLEREFNSESHFKNGQENGLMFFSKKKDTTELENSTKQAFLHLDLHAIMYAGLLQDLCFESGLKLSSSNIRLILILLFWNVYIFELGRLTDKKKREVMNLYGLLQFVTVFNNEFERYEKYDIALMGFVIKYADPTKGTTINNYVNATQDLINMWSENKAFKSTPIFEAVIGDFISKTFSPIGDAILNFNIKYK